MDTKVIVAFDGGGVRGAFASAVVSEIDAWRRVKGDSTFFEMADLIAGTSTGGILALALAMGIPSAEIMEFYRTHAHLIFPVQKRWSYGRVKGAIKGLFQSRYAKTHLRDALGAVFSKYPAVGGSGPPKFGDCKKETVIVSYDIDAGVPKLFASTDPLDRELSIVEVAMASAAAPTYFDSVQLRNPVTNNYSRHIDGGLWANCPALAAYAYLRQKNPDPALRIKVVSFGTMHSAPDLWNLSRAKGGKLSWGFQMLDMLFHCQMQGQRRMLADLIGLDYLALDKPPQKPVQLDDASKVELLINEGRNAAFVCQHDFLRWKNS